MQAQHPKLYSDLLQAEKEVTFESPGLQPGGPVIFASDRIEHPRLAGGGGPKLLSHLLRHAH